MERISSRVALIAASWVEIASVINSAELFFTLLIAFAGGRMRRDGAGPTLETQADQGGSSRLASLCFPKVRRTFT